MRALFALLAISLAAAANAQEGVAATIERVKITDNDLSCQQIFDERSAMDRHVADAREAQSSGKSKATAGQAAGVAAEVASRTGLFGALGGLTGHILGSVGSKAAANVAEQSGQQDATQAVEREKAALGRKEHLSQLFLAKGCSASDPSAPPKTPAATLPMPAPLQAAAPMSPEQSLRAALDGLKMQPMPVALRSDITDALKSYRKVVVPQFRVAFVAKTSVSARGGAGFSNLGQSTGFNRTITQAQSKRIDMMLGNVDYALMQGVADRLYADFVDRLKAAGKEVVPLDTLKQSAGYAKIKFAPAEKPYTKSPFDDPREYIFATPKDLPLAFMHLDTALGNAGPFDQDTTKAIHEIAAGLDALALLPTVVIDFAQLESSGRSNYATSAEAEATPRIGLGVNTLLPAVTGKDAKIFFTGEIRFARMQTPTFVDGDFGSVKQVDSFDNVALANSLTALSGAQGTQYRYEKRLVSADPVAYARKALQAGASINSAFADSLRNNPQTAM